MALEDKKPKIEDAHYVNEQRIASLLEENINEATLEKEHRDRQKKTNQVFSFAGASKRKFVIEENNWSTSLEKRQAPGYQVGSRESPRRDKFRDVAGKYWGYDNKRDSPRSVGFIERGSSSNRGANIPFSTWTSEPIYNLSPDEFVGEHNPFFEVEQVVRLKANKHSFTDNKGNYRTDNWKTLIDGLFPVGTDYDYLAFDMQMPFNYRELDSLSIAGPQYAKIRPEYNFYIQGYEHMLRFGDGLNQPETTFPNLYALMLEKINDTSNPVFVDHLTLGGTISANEAAVGASKKHKFDIKKHSGQYFDIYGRSFSKATKAKIAELGRKFKNIVVPVENVNLLKEISDKKELFPMFVDMEFSTDKMTEFAQMLSETMLTDDFIWSMVKDITSSTGFEEINFMEVVETSAQARRPDDTPFTTKSMSTTSTVRKVWNILSWLKNNSLMDFETGTIKTPSFSAEDEENALKSTVLLDDGTLQDNMTVDPRKKFFRSLLGVIFLGKLKTFLKNRFRTFDEIIEGHPCHTESVLYRVEKTLANEAGLPAGQTIQNFWFPNTNQIDVLHLVDTQIKYNKKYAYRIYAYQLAVNTKYSYDRLKVWNRHAAFRVKQRPEVLLIEQEIFTDDHLIIDDPPVPPEVEIVPYFADGRNLLFNLKSAVGEYKFDPVALNNKDVAAHAEIRRAQKVGINDPIRFKSDDPIGKEGYFEIYRLQNHPKSWSDFHGNLLTSIANNSTYGNTESLSASSAEYIDRIASNRKYYYICRMIDVHGHVSNPSDIYEVELVNDEGSVYMIKRIVDFSPVEPKHPSKKMRRLLQIKPGLEHTYIDEDLLDGEKSAFRTKNVKLGLLEESPWGRKFKFRLVSRKTGKKIDLNVDFKTAMQRKSTLK